MLPNLKEIYYPKNLSDAVKILKKGRGSIIPVAGCTAIGLMKNPRIVGLVDIEPLRLNFIKKSSNRSLIIGAGLTLTELIEDNSVQRYCDGILTQAGRTIGKTTNRNMITVGGNIVQLHPWSALPVVFLSLDAEVVVMGVKKRKVPAEQLFSKHPSQLIKFDEIVVEVQLPSEFADARGKYLKFALTENDYPLVSIAVVAKKKAGRLEKLRLTVGALTLLPQRLYEVEKLLTGSELSQKLIDDAVRSAVEKLNIAGDIRVSKEYKMATTKNLVVEILKDIVLG